MATLVGVFNTAHSPFCYMSPEDWEKRRASRPPYAPSVPIDDHETNLAKAARVAAGFATLREKIAAVAPDVLIVFGDDQHEMFDFANHPSIALYLGDSFVGHPPDGAAMASGQPSERAMQTVPGHRALGTHMLTGLLAHGFDPAFMLELPKPETGMCHAVINAVSSLTDGSIPTVPLLANAYFAPQLTATRCYEIGRAVRSLIDSYPEDLRVAVVGSGGLWHTPGQPSSQLDESFDRDGLAYLEKGDIKGWATHFDAYIRDPDDPSQSYDGRGSTKLPQSSGPQGGTRETCNWIGAAAVADGCGETIVDYIPIYASPIGAAFAYTIEV